MERKIFLAAIVLVAAVPALAGAQAFSDEDFCRVMTEEARVVNLNHPAWTGYGIRNDGMAVHCLQKTIEYRIYMKMDPRTLTQEWKDRRTRFWGGRVCQGALLDAVRNGWEIAEVLQVPKTPQFPDGFRQRVVATCR
ncbi:MAG: hypothetical protein FJX42_06665 [Alphaproteobacteria bacterium]|nr:hypothetical protein [Alphaproteobacteria bacterium]